MCISRALFILDGGVDIGGMHEGALDYQIR